MESYSCRDNQIVFHPIACSRKGAGPKAKASRNSGYDREYGPKSDHLALGVIRTHGIIVSKTSNDPTRHNRLGSPTSECRVVYVLVHVCLAFPSEGQLSSLIR